MVPCIALWDLEGGKTIKGAINFYVGGEGADPSKNMDLSNYYYILNTILSRKYNTIFCILSLSHNIYIKAIKKLTKPLKVTIGPKRSRPTWKSIFSSSLGV